MAISRTEEWGSNCHEKAGMWNALVFLRGGAGEGNPKFLTTLFQGMLSMDYHHVTKLKFAYQNPKQKPNNSVATEASEEQVVYHFAILLEIESREFSYQYFYKKLCALRQPWAIFFNMIRWLLRAFWLVLVNDLLKDSPIDDATVNSILFFYHLK